MAKGPQGSSHHLKAVGSAYGKRKDLIYENLDLLTATPSKLPATII